MGFSALANAIKNTLLQGYEVSLAGIGSLTLHQEHSRLVRTEGIIYPPRKMALFTYDPNAGTSEEVFVPISNDHDKTIFKSVIEGEIEDLRLSLQSGSRVFLTDVGTLFYTSGHLIAFTPDSFNYDLSVYGLDPVAVRPIIKRTAKEAAEKAIDARKSRPALTTVKNKRIIDKWFIPVTALLLISALGIAGWLMLSDSIQGEAEVESDQNISESDEIDYAQVSEADLRKESDISTITDEDEISEDTILRDDRSESLENPSVQSKGAEQADRYTHSIIIGHFGDPNNADQVVKRLENLNFKGETLVTSQGLIRVLAKIDASKDDPEASLALLRSEFDQGAWIVKD